MIILVVCGINSYVISTNLSHKIIFKTSTLFEGALYPPWIIYFIFGIVLKWDRNDELLYWLENSITFVTMLFGYYQTTKGV